ncbi:hypothetical protein QBC44DRAFT_373405 [Cladorrhinum sp. PSN332]|nr:hypothetical protein QBC44DRAFT_373405 [Cladorrhinum sp. PSN332]
MAENINAMSYDSESTLLGSTKLTLQNQHHACLREIRAYKACEFLLTDPKFNR